MKFTGTALTHDATPARRLVEELLTPTAFPHPVQELRLRETPLSWVILTGPFAYKIKKPLHLEFIDTLELATRRRMCEQELQLNRRLAPDLYIDVVPIARHLGAVHMGGPGEPLEYAVKMREFAEADELRSLLDSGGVCVPEILDLAERLAVFHRGAPVAPMRRDDGPTELLHDAVLGNLATLLAHLGDAMGLDDLSPLIDWTHDQLQALLPRLRLRESQGYIRECHGDLHAGNIVRWQGHLIPFDCLDFDPHLRWIDVLNDVAFLVMDLVSHDRSDLAYGFLNRYLEVTGDYDGADLVPFYAVYRALVRAMVDALTAEAEPARRPAAQDRLRRRVNTAAYFMRPPVPPRLMLMHGLSGSGKTWLSKRLVLSLGALRLRSDVERKRLPPSVPSSAAAPGSEQGFYGPDATHRTYARLLACAEKCLAGHFNTIVDAAFLDRSVRRLFEELASRRHVSLVILSCNADQDLLMQRVAQRTAGHADASDADLDVLHWQTLHCNALEASEQPHVVQINTAEQHVVEHTLAALSLV